MPHSGVQKQAETRGGLQMMAAPLAKLAGGRLQRCIAALPQTGARRLNTIYLVAGLILAVSACDGNSGNRQPTFHALAGSITSAIGTAVDSDVNDPQAPYTSNDTPETAQSLLVPVLLGGFVSRVGSGGGNFLGEGDATDIYQMTLAEGQSVTLFISDHDRENPRAVDIDLEIYDTPDITPETQPVAQSVSASAGAETVRAPKSGRYYIVIHASMGASNYLLTVGWPTTLNTTALQTTAPFIPGEVIVRFKQPMAAASDANYFAAATGLKKKKGATGRTMLFTLNDEGQSLPAKPGGMTAADDGSRLARLKRKTIDTVNALRKRPDIESADLNYLRYATAIPDDEYYPRQWNYPLINLPQAWSVTALPAASEHPVIVAVVDTGVMLNHPDLKANLSPAGYDFISDPAIAADGDGIDDNPDDPGDGDNMQRSSFHGTHVAGIIGAQSNNKIGVSGISWGTNTKIMPIRVLGRGGGTTYDIIQGVRYAAGLSNDSKTVPPQRADIINLSLGGAGFTMAEQAEYNAIRDAGILIVAAAGNGSSANPSYPAAYDSVLSVSAVTLAREKAPYSNFGSTIDIAAPGGDTLVDSDGDGWFDGILSTLAKTDGSNGAREAVYSFAQGTSMAAPHVSGVAAIMKALDARLDSDKFTALLRDGRLTTDLGAPGRDDQFGYGLLDALKAVENIDVELPPIISTNPSGGLNFGPFVTQLEFTTRNAGGGSFSITGVTTDVNWLDVTPRSLEGSEGTFTATVNRADLDDGIYRATITIETDNARSLTVPVTLQVGDRREEGDTGHTYVLLVDPLTLETTHTIAVNNRAGRYDYRFDRVPEGSYFIIAGTDLDNDGLICDPGEACGGYPTIERLQAVSVYSNVDGLDFGSNFEIVIRPLANHPEQPKRHGYSRNPNG